MGRRNSVLLEDLIDPFDLLGEDVDQDHVLGWGQAHLGVVGIDYLTQSTLETYLIRILDASCLHEKPQKGTTVRLLVPTKAISLTLESIRSWVFQCKSESTFQLPAEPSDSLFFENVFQACVFAIGTISEISMNRQNGLGNSFHLVPLEKADDIGFSGVGIRIVVTHSQSTPCGQIVSNQFAFLFNGDEPEAVGEQIHIIERRNGKGCLEFAR